MHETRTPELFPVPESPSSRRRLLALGKQLRPTRHATSLYVPFLQLAACLNSELNLDCFCQLQPRFELDYPYLGPAHY